MSLVLPTQQLINIDNTEFLLFEKSIVVNDTKYQLQQIQGSYIEDFDEFINNNKFYLINNDYLCVKYNDKIYKYNIKTGEIEDLTFRLQFYKDSINVLSKYGKIGNAQKMNRKFTLNIAVLFLVY